MRGFGRVGALVLLLQLGMTGCGSDENSESKDAQGGSGAAAGAAGQTGGTGATGGVGGQGGTVETGGTGGSATGGTAGTGGGAAGSAGEPPTPGFAPEPGFSVSILEGTGFAQGATLRITDSQERFGTKDHQQTFVFDDYEDGTLGQPVDRSYYGSGSNADFNTFSDDEVYAGAQSYKADWDRPTHSGPWIAFDHRSVYMSFRFRLTEHSQTYDGSSAPQLKLPHFSLDPGKHEPAAGYINGGIHGLDVTEGTTYPAVLRENYSIVGNTSPDVSSSAWGGDSSTPMPRDQWHRLEYFWLLNTGNNPDGTLYVKVNQRGGFGYSGWPDGAHFASPTTGIPADHEYWGELRRVRPDDSLGNIRTGFLPFYKRSWQRLSYWVDELYVDAGSNEMSQARIEVGPDAFGLDSRDRNPCRYQAWSEGQVEIVLNNGPNTTLSGRALYLVSGTGVVTKIGQFE